MWPKTIAIHKNANGIDPVSPIPVRKDDFPGDTDSKKSNDGSGSGSGNISSGRCSSNSRTVSGSNFSSRNQVSSSLSSSSTSTSKSKSKSSLSSKLSSKSKFKSSSSSSKLLLASKQGMELDELKSKYEETKLKMEKMKKEKSENNKRLLELSGVVKSLQDIPIKYEKSSTTTTIGIDGSSDFDNVQRKIVAIDTEMKKAKERYDELLNEKSFQTDTIVSQELHIKSMKDQIQELTQQAEKSNNNTNGELEQTIQLQEQQIENLVGEIGELKKDDIVHVNTTTNTTNTDLSLIHI